VRRLEQDSTESATAKSHKNLTACYVKLCPHITVTTFGAKHSYYNYS